MLQKYVKIMFCDMLYLQLKCFSGSLQRFINDETYEMVKVQGFEEKKLHKLTNYISELT